MCVVWAFNILFCTGWLSVEYSCRVRNMSLPTRLLILQYDILVSYDSLCLLWCWKTVSYIIGSNYRTNDASILFQICFVLNVHQTISRRFYERFACTRRGVPFAFCWDPGRIDQKHETCSHHAAVLSVWVVPRHQAESESTPALWFGNYWYIETSNSPRFASATDPIFLCFAFFLFMS